MMEGGCLDEAPATSLTPRPRRGGVPELTDTRHIELVPPYAITRASVRQTRHRASLPCASADDDPGRAGARNAPSRNWW